MERTPGPIIRVRCTTPHCKHHGLVRVHRVDREGDVLLVPRLVCVSCLGDMQVLNRQLTRLNGASDDAPE